jgi:hypothetical protein
VAYRDTGILLAAADDTGTETLEPKPLNMDDMQLSIEKYMEDADKRKLCECCALYSARHALMIRFSHLSLHLNVSSPV